ncbi:Nucleoside diphosphate kinase 7 [Boothiomyces macroporosus]|uniref:Nucleoside diphosphate kinase n=1 Tax=Boothiomyces macroporosus TaxID=261099 RepID=A0AAD5UGF8_9FUNG|nr:Nucleoside diphosphate kinase 7 [Boothiomyces macroporosus]
MEKLESDPKTRYCFLTEWFDFHAQLYRQYEFFFYPSDSTIEMRRTFLKRSKSEIRLIDLFLGAAINVHSRQLVIKDYGDEYTRKHLKNQLTSSLLVIKPEGVPFLGEILTGLHEEKFSCCRMRMANLDDSIANQLNTSGLNGTSIVLEVLRADAYNTLNKLVESEFEKYVKTPSVRSFLHIPSDEKDVDRQLNAVFGTNIPRTATFKNWKYGPIIKDIQKHFKISDMELVHLDNRNGEEFLEVYKGVVPEYHLMLTQLTAGPLIAMELVGDGDIVQKFRELAGPGDPALAKQLRPDSLRAKYGVDKVKNAVHCTDLPEDGVLEVIDLNRRANISLKSFNKMTFSDYKVTLLKLG